MRYGIVTANLGEYSDPCLAVDLARAAEEADMVRVRVGPPESSNPPDG